uniref:Uncharacterized protein n=1 Tax=Setaria italica TaxID=4555 RepID=K3ZBN7_SETIT
MTTKRNPYHICFNVTMSIQYPNIGKIKHVNAIKSPHIVYLKSHMPYHCACGIIYHIIFTL